MAEGTTRVERTGGEPIASELEWEAAVRGEAPAARPREAPRPQAQPSAPATAPPAARYGEAGARPAPDRGVREIRRRIHEAKSPEAKGPDPTARIELLRRDIEENRRIVAQVVEELDERRRELMDARLQFRRHRAAFLAGAAGFVLLAGTSVLLVLRRQRLRRRPAARVRRLADALGRMIERPEAVARPSPMVRERVLGSAASGASGVLAKKVASRIAGMV
ncbi:MAG TPA: hypothetical protein VN033_12620 [Vulgatibacter sp.]|nr:hypothetical protein [Vulgatibacter sp.]